MCLFHLLLLRQVFCRASTDNGFPVHQGTALLPNKMPATSGLALSQHKLPDFIPSVHTVLAALLSLGLSVFFPVPISAIQTRSLQLPVTSSFWQLKVQIKTRMLAKPMHKQKGDKKSPNVTMQHLVLSVDEKMNWKSSGSINYSLISKYTQLQLKPTLLLLF